MCHVPCNNAPFRSNQAKAQEKTIAISAINASRTFDLFPHFLFLSLLNFLHEVFLQLRHVHHVLLLVGLHPVVLHQAPVILYEGNVKKKGRVRSWPFGKEIPLNLPLLPCLIHYHLLVTPQLGLLLSPLLLFSLLLNVGSK